MSTAFANPSRKGNSGKCRSDYCNDRHAGCRGSSACCTCHCDSGRTYDADKEDCVLAATTRVPTTSSLASTATTSRRTTETRTAIATTSTTSTTSATTTLRPEIRTSTSALTTKIRSVTTRETSTASTTKALRPETTTQTTAKETYTTSGRLLSTKQASIIKPTHRKPPIKRPTKTSGKTTVKPRTTTYPQKASTTGSQGNKDMIRGGNKSNAAAIAGAIVGVIILIVLAAVFLYLRKRKQKKGAKDVNGKAPLDIHFNDLKSREEPVSPSSPPDGIYTYADAGTISRPNGSTLNAVGNPAYSDNIPISEPFYNVLEADQNDSQPIYREVVPEQVYMDPNANRNAGGNQDQQEQPIYRELEEEPPAYAPIDQPIYRELEEETPASPVYADITSSTVDNTGPQSPRQYQELNYAATANVYQPLDNDWKSQKYNR